MEEQFLFQVNLGGMIDILANHLYSTPEVFLRELLQNAVDAISSRKKQQPEYQDGSIRFSVKKGEQLVFTDTGAGLTKEEIHRFLAVIGQSSKRDLETGRVYEDYIGRFGIGLLSCFMVSDEIIVRTRSIRTPDKLMEFRAAPDGTYTITELTGDEKPDIGTDIILNAKRDARQYYDEERITELLHYYGLPITMPIYCVRDGVKEQINVDFGSSADIMELGRTIFGTEFLTYIPLESRSGLFSGVAYVLAHPSSVHAKLRHRIYLKNLLLTEDGESLLPIWSSFLRCFINTNTLRPTASRESFYEDDMLFEAREEISSCISEYLLGLSEHDPQMLEKIIRVHFLTIKSMAAEDMKYFETFFPFLMFETNQGDKNGTELLKYNGPIYIASDINHYNRSAALMVEEGMLLLNACYVYDQNLIHNMLEFDPTLDLRPLDTSSLEEFLSRPASASGSEWLMEVASELFDSYRCTAELRTFAAENIPVFYMLDADAETLQEIQRSKENSSSLFSGMLDKFAEELQENRAKIFLNWRNPLIRRLAEIGDEEKVSVCLKILYIQSLLIGHYRVGKAEMQEFNQDLIRLLEWGLGGAV